MYNISRIGEKNMNDTVTRKKSNGGIIAGLLFVIIGIILLWFNEGRTVKTAETIDEAQTQYIDVSSTKINSNNNGKLIATNGKLELPSSGVTDTYFDVTVPSAKLTRTVEMYQWKESCKTDNNGNERCSYSKQWSDELINSNSFANPNYSNPSTMPYSSDTYYAQNVKLGAYNVNSDLLNQLNTNTKVTVTDNQNSMRAGLNASGYYYTNVQNNNPQIGDVRISFSYSNASNVSILAIQSNNTFTPFESTNGYSIYELQEGIMDGKEILNKLTNENNTLKWVLRLIGTIFVIGGFAVMISPLQRLANFIPILGTIFGWVSGFITVVLGLGVSLIVIALAWLRYRPIFSIILLVVVAAVIILLKKKRTKKLNNTTIQNPVQTPMNNQTPINNTISNNIQSAQVNAPSTINNLNQQSAQAPNITNQNNNQN